MPLHGGRLASRARAGLRDPAGAGTADRCRGAPGHGPGRGCRLRRAPSRAEPWALVFACRRAPSPAAAGRRLCAGRPGGGRPRRHHRAALGRADHGARDLPRPGPLQPRPLRQGQRPALALRHAARARALGRLRLGAALPGRAGALRAARRRTRHPLQEADRPGPPGAAAGRRAGCPGGASSRWPTAASPPSPCCATSRRT